MNTKNLLVLPDNLPAPEDDGACAHFEGMNRDTNLPLSGGGDGPLFSPHCGVDIRATEECGADAAGTQSCSGQPTPAAWADLPYRSRHRVCR